jgi:hypothetical protein
MESSDLFYFWLANFWQLAFKNKKEFALGGSHIQRQCWSVIFFNKKFPLRKFEFFNINKLGYIGEACFNSVNLTKFVIFGKNLQNFYPKKMKKIKKMGITCSLVPNIFRKPKKWRFFDFYFYYYF